MARGANRTTQPWIPKRDRQEIERYRSVFYLRVKNSDLANQSTDRYAQARDEGHNGQARWNPVILRKADRSEFLMLCDRVDNWGFSEDYLEAHPDVAAKCDEDGFYQGSILLDENEELLSDIAGDMDRDLWDEILESCRNRSKLEEGHPKNIRQQFN